MVPAPYAPFPSPTISPSTAARHDPSPQRQHRPSPQLSIISSSYSPATRHLRHDHTPPGSKSVPNPTDATTRDAAGTGTRVAPSRETVARTESRQPISVGKSSARIVSDHAARVGSEHAVVVGVGAGGAGGDVGSGDGGSEPSPPAGGPLCASTFPSAASQLPEGIAAHSDGLYCVMTSRSLVACPAVNSLMQLSTA